MKTSRGFISPGIIFTILIGIAVLGGIVYFATKSIPSVPQHQIQEEVNKVPSSALLYVRHGEFGLYSSNDRSGYVIAATQSGTSVSTTSLYRVASYFVSEYASYSRATNRIVYVDAKEDILSGETNQSSLTLFDKGASRVLVQAPAGWKFEGPILSADGTHVAYVRSDNTLSTTHVELWGINADGSDNKIISPDILSHVPPMNDGVDILGWSPNNQKIFFRPISHSDRPSDTVVYSINISSREIKVEHDLYATSPDGLTSLLIKNSRVGADSKDVGEDGISIVDLKSGIEKNIITDATRSFGRVAWSPDGTKILYVAARKGSIELSGFDGSPHRTLDQYALYTFDLASDKERKILDFPTTWWPTQIFWASPSSVAYVVDRNPSACCTFDYSRLYMLTISNEMHAPQLIDSADIDGISILGEYNLN